MRLTNVVRKRQYIFQNTNERNVSMSIQISKLEEVDGLSKMWLDLQTLKFNLAQSELELILRIEALADSSKDQGVVNIFGSSTTIKMTRRVNVRYEKDGNVDPLAALTTEFPEMLEYVTLSVSEKGSRLDKVFSKKEDELTTFEQMIVKKLEAFRVSNQGKPSITIVPHGKL